MCGIFGYVNEKEAVSLLLEGLKKLEYRGYDSAGVATIHGDHLDVRKCQGKIVNLETLLLKDPAKGHVGIGHTRWATHGEPSTENAHPHIDCKKEIALVHNGIIENYVPLKRKLEEEGHVFTSQTDTEVLVHLIEKHFTGNLEKAVMQALKEVVGAYAIAVISSRDPKKLVVARKSSPLLIGLGEGECYIASDIPAMMKYSGRMVHLNDGEIGVLCKDFVEVYTPEGKLVEKEIEFVSWDPVTAEKGGYTHFMLKEIHEQPRAIHDTFIGRMSLETGIINFDELKISQKELAKVKRIILTACGTSWHACLIGEYLIEQMAKIPVEVENAAEFRYRSPVLDKGTLVIAVSQSGETADTLGAVKEAHALGAKVLSICNVVGSSLARESDGIIYTRGGPEIGVASTKAFTTQLVVFYLLSLLLSKLKKTMGIHEIKKHLKQLAEIPQKVETILQNEKIIEEISERYYQVTNALFLGRGKGYPIALEGALKLKEISYIHAEGYPAAEMKHGPIALIDENMPVVVLIFKGRRYEKILGNIEEVKARRGKIIAIASEGDTEIKNKADDVIYIPDSSEELSPILAVLPLQLFAYYAAVKRGCSIDQPRHLAKSVTVE